MWVDADRVAHTAVPPNWRTVVSVGSEALRALRGAPWLDNTLEEERESIFERISSGEIPEGGVVAAVPMQSFALTAADLASPEAFRLRLTAVSEWWLLDVLDAIEDAV